MKKALLILTLAMTLSPMTVLSQRDDLIPWEDDNGLRTAEWTWVISNNDFGAPLGSGLLVLAAACAGYAFTRRRRNRNNGMLLLLALMMFLGMSGCKKKIVEPIAPTGGTTYTINLNVGKGSRVEVDPPHVNFTNGDKLLVAYDGKYAGTLTHDGSKFTGSITTTISGTQPLYFYFLGNKDTGTLTAGTTTSCTVNISDQTAYPALPVISFSASDEDFSGSGSYSAALNNKCSLIKFNVTTPTNYPICITGMNNKVTVDFSKAANDVQNNGFTYDKEGEGIIKMKGGSGSPAVKWVIVLPQDELSEGAEGTAYSEDYSYVGARAAVPAITMNQYLNEDRTMTVNTPAWDGDLSKLTDESTEAYATARNVMTITGTLGVNKKVSIADGATVTLDNVVIQPIGYLEYEQRWAGITCLGDAIIILKDGTSNTVKNFGHEETPGIYVPENKTLIIQGNTGSLTVRGEYGAAIGSGTNYSGAYASCGNIVINGGTITTSNHMGAGIGCGDDGSCGNINITGGTITTGSSESGAGIGSCGSGSCGDITISGGTVNAYSMYGAGIGCSDNSGGSCGTITISGGNVYAQSEYGAGIGSGNNGSCGNIIINGGNINARSEFGAGIGSGDNSACGDITITSGVTQVTATTSSMEGYNSIGKGNSSKACGIVTIGGIVYYDGSSYQNGGNTYLATKPLIYSAHYFSVSSTKRVIFALGNLQATYYNSPFSYWTWSIATHQWDYIGNAAGNTSINGNGTASDNNVTVDLFGWVGYSSSWSYWNSEGTVYGISNSTTDSNYGNVAGEALKYNWGNAIGTGWRTLTSAEWQYVFNTRTVNGGTGSGHSYTLGQSVNGVLGLVIYPDNYAGSVYAGSDWSTFEAAGCVFLPAAGDRDGVNIFSASESGYYWSSSSHESSAASAYCFWFNSSSLALADAYNRHWGLSVRLVRDAN
ncbi:MAG: hypothetical protein J5708_04620 [Bacteroidales bacterium]|nr:hypothetical protein [Bacteroidales bacterium]